MPAVPAHKEFQTIMDLIKFEWHESAGKAPSLMV